MEIDLEVFNRPKILIKECKDDRLIEKIEPKREYLWEAAGEVLKQMFEYNERNKDGNNQSC